MFLLSLAQKLGFPHMYLIMRFSRLHLLLSGKIEIDSLEVISVLIENFSKTVVCVVYCPPNCCSNYSNDLDIILFDTFGAFQIMILLSLWGILMRQISTGPHCVVIYLTLPVNAISCVITICLKSFRFQLILEGII